MSREPEITINTSEFDHLERYIAPLYIQTAGKPWSAYLTLDRSGVCGFNHIPPYDRRKPEDVSDGRTRCWEIPAAVAGRALSRLLNDKHTQLLLQRVYDGLAIKWDGKCLYGVLNADAGEANEELHALFAKLEDACAEVVPAEDFIAPSKLSDIWPAGMTLDDAVGGIARAAFEQDLFCGGRVDIEEALIRKLQSIVEGHEGFTLTEEQVAALKGQR